MDSIGRQRGRRGRFCGCESSGITRIHMRRTFIPEIKDRFFFFFHVRETDCHINFHKLSYLLFFFPLSIAILFMFLRMDNTSKIIIIFFSLVVLAGDSVTLLVVS